MPLAYLPAAHPRQAEAPVAAWYWPEGHGEQEAETAPPSTADQRPAAQPTHADVPVEEAKEPAAHRSQAEAPAGEKLPEEHASHAADANAPDAAE